MNELPARGGFKNTARAAARRAGILGYSALSAVAGPAKSMWEGNSGTAILLLHNSLPREADALMAYVQQNRQRFARFSGTAAAVTNPTPTPTQITLSFDDGFASNLDIARRLAEVDLTACFYVCTDIIGAQKSDVDAFFRRPQAEGVLTWDDLETMRSLGHTIGSHCREHKPLIEQSDAAAEDQIKGSLEVLRAKLGDADQFAWPFGSLRHADAQKVVTWCQEAGAMPASGVRGFNTHARFLSDGYLRRDAVDLTWLKADTAAFLGRDS